MIAFFMSCRLLGNLVFPLMYIVSGIFGFHEKPQDVT
jgi:hypothetical protein